MFASCVIHRPRVFTNVILFEYKIYIYIPDMTDTDHVKVNNDTLFYQQ